jgi:PleD family two-component response regulator
VMRADEALYAAKNGGRNTWRVLTDVADVVEGAA